MPDQTRTRRIALYAATAVVACIALWMGYRWFAAAEHPGNAGVRRSQDPRADAGAVDPDRSSREGDRRASARNPAPSGSSPRARRNRGDALIEAKWGGGKGELGLSRPAEGNPEAPMSFAMGQNGGAFVLDQVNGRLVSYGADGSSTAELRLEQRVPQDVTVADDGSVLVLDRLGDKTIAVYGPDGAPKGTIPLGGKGIDEPGGVTGVFVDGNDVYAEVEHGTLVSVGTTDGKAAEERKELPGRPSRDGRLLLSAGIIQAQEGRMYVSAVRREPIEHQFTREFRLTGPVLYLLLLDSDRLGTIYVAALHETTTPDAPSVTLMCLEPERGEPLGSVELPANTSADETFREMVVLDEGGVVYAVRTEAGISYRYYACP